MAQKSICLRFITQSLLIFLPVYALAENDAPLELDTVTVTGQKIERTQQETVESVTIYDAAALEDSSRASDFYDLLDSTANVSRGGSFDFTIRGISSNGPTGANNTARLIGVFLDGSPQAARSTQSGAFSLWDIEQIEILRGPQSTNQGRNTLAGAFVVSTKDPEFESNGTLRLAYGEENTYQAAIAQTGPITDNLAYRIAIDRQHTDGFVENTVFVDDAWDEEENTTIRGKLLYLTDSGTEIVLGVNAVRHDDQGDDNVFGDPSKRESVENFRNTWLTNTETYTLRVDKELSPAWRLSSVTTHTDSEFDRDSDADATTTVAGNAILKQDTTEDNLTQEFLLNYASDRAKGLAGLYLAKGELADSFSSEGVVFALGEINVPGVGPITVPPIEVNGENATVAEYENAAVFFNLDYSLTEHWTLIGGLRADYEKRSNSIVASSERIGSTGIAQVDALIDNQIASGGGRSEGEDESAVLLPKLGVNYRWNDHVSTGFVVQRGYRSGGISTNFARNETKEFDAEFITNYELSMRSLWFENRLRVNANIFYTDWQDQQIQVQGDLGNFDRFIENAGESTVQGFEIETQYVVNKSLELNASVGYTETEFVEFNSSLGDAFNGNEFAFARDWTANLGATYRQPSGFFAWGNVSYVGEGFNNVQNSVELESYTIANVKAGYEQSGWSAYVYVNNLFDEEYIAEEYDNSIRTFVLGDPRVIGLVAELYW